MTSIMGKMETSQMRIAKDLIIELDEESSRHWYAGLFVAFETSTVIVHANDDLRYLQAGQNPIGLMAADWKEKELTISKSGLPRVRGCGVRTSGRLYGRVGGSNCEAASTLPS